jgi:hypothetical protein
MVITKSRVFQTGLAILVCGASAAGCNSESPNEPSPSSKRALGKFTIVAGGGHNLNPERTGQPTEAEFNSPSELAIAPDGTAYIGEPLRNIVYRLPPNGHISIAVDRSTTFPSASGAGVETFDSPTSLATDARGNLFIGDQKYQAIRELTLDGRRLTVAGANPEKVDVAHGKIDLARGDGKPATAVRLGNPISIVAAPDLKSLYVTVRASEESSIVRKVTLAGQVQTVAGRVADKTHNNPTVSGQSPAASVTLIRSTFLALDSDGSLLVLTKQLLRLNDGKVEPIPATKALETLERNLGKAATRIAVLNNGDYVIRIDSSLYRISKGGKVTAIATGRLCTDVPQFGDFGDFGIHDSYVYMANAECRLIVKTSLN